MIHTIIVAGGQGSRLAKSSPEGTPPKPLLPDATGSPLIANTIAAGSLGGDVVVVAPVELVPAELRSSVTITREDPPLSGPASALSAGLAKLGAKPAGDQVLFLATDYADPAAAVAAMRAAGSNTVAVADGHREPLLCLADVAQARRAFAGVTGGSVRRVLARMELTDVPVDAAIVADIDTWGDAQEHGFG